MKNVFVSVYISIGDFLLKEKASGVRSRGGESSAAADATVFETTATSSDDAACLPDALAELLGTEDDVVGAEVRDLGVSRGGHRGSPKFLARFRQRVDIVVRSQEIVHEIRLRLACGGRALAWHVVCLAALAGRVERVSVLERFGEGD